MTDPWADLPDADVKPGDQLERFVSGDHSMGMFTVEKVENHVIHVQGGWTFDARTGFEIDEDLPLPDGVVASIVKLPGRHIRMTLPNGTKKEI